MIVYLMTLLISGTMNARAVVMDIKDCEALGKKIAGNAPALTVKVQCEALPMYYASVTPPVTPPQPSFFPKAPVPPEIMAPVPPATPPAAPPAPPAK